MEHPVPAPPELGELDGLAYALFLPDGEPRAGVVILHGAGSAKESHFDFARGCRAKTMHEIEGSIRQSRFGNEFCQTRRCHRSPFRRFGNDRIPGRQGRSKFRAKDH